MLLTPLFRFALLGVLPILALGAGAGIWLSEDGNRAKAMGMVAWAEYTFKNNDAFAVGALVVEADSPELQKYVESNIQFDAGSGPFGIDPDAIKASVEAHSAVLDASVDINPGGNVEIAVRGRKPEVVLRRAGELSLLDRFGEQVFAGGAAVALADLPLIAGDGAEGKVAEALEIQSAAGSLRHAIRGLVRVGERRWDLMLDGGRLIRLPEENPAAALRQLISFDRRKGLLSRDYEVIDLRLPGQVTIRLSSEVLARAVEQTGISDGVKA